MISRKNRQSSFYFFFLRCTFLNDFTNFFSNFSVKAKLVHEQLAFQFFNTSGKERDNALKSSWFFLELMIKAMIEHLATTDRLNANRKHRFSEQFHDDIINLTASITHDIVRNRQNDAKLVENLNSR